MIRTVVRSPWTDEDRALLLGYRQYLASLCDGCGEPRAKAHHPDNDGVYEVEVTAVCHACTARARHTDDAAPEVELIAVVDTRDYATDPLPQLAPVTYTRQPTPQAAQHPEEASVG